METRRDLDNQKLDGKKEDKRIIVLYCCNQTVISIQFLFSSGNFLQHKKKLCDPGQLVNSKKCYHQAWRISRIASMI